MQVMALVLAVPLFWGSLKPGPHAVGFRVQTAMSAPGSAGWQPRAINVAVWYPAVKNDRAAMTFGDYFQAADDLRRRSGDLSVAISGAPDAVPVEKIAGAAMYARRDAEPQRRRFPVVLFSARYGTVAAQSVLAESLASRGFVVAAAWPKDAPERLPFELKTAADKLEELDAQTDDLRGALRAIRELPYANDRTALIAWSYAGESAWQLAQGDGRVELVIGLDTNVRTNWVYRAGQSPEAAPQRVRFVEFDKRSEGLAHGNFNALEGMIPAVLGIEKVHPWSRSGPEAKRGYETLVRRVATTIEDTLGRKTPPAPERIEIRASDGAIVTSELHRGGARCIALFHQSGSSRGEYRTIAPELLRLGYTVLAADIRWGNRDRWNDVRNENAALHGTPAAMETRDMDKIAAIKAGESRDLDAAVDWLKANGCRGPVVAWGASIQANGVLELATRRPDDIAAVVDVSPGEYDKNAPDKMKGVAVRVTQPALVLWGRNEANLSKPVFDALPAGKKTSYASTGRHGNAIFFEDPQAWAALREFLASLE